MIKKKQAFTPSLISSSCHWLCKKNKSAVQQKQDVTSKKSKHFLFLETDMADSKSQRNKNFILGSIHLCPPRYIAREIPLRIWPFMMGVSEFSDTRLNQVELECRTQWFSDCGDTAPQGTSGRG